MASTNSSEIARIFQLAPFIAELGIGLDSISPGECHTSMALERRHLQQDGYVHAGVQATIADHTAGAAAASLVASGEYVLSAEFKINLLRAAKGSRLTCIAKVLKAGKSLTVVESEVFCGTPEEMRLVSKATVTLAVVTPRARS
jgi:uncharacterized protein (TIGR00369 family)